LARSPLQRSRQTLAQSCLENLTSQFAGPGCGATAIGSSKSGLETVTSSRLLRASAPKRRRRSTPAALVTESYVNPHLHLCKVWTLPMMEEEALKTYHGE